MDWIPTWDAQSISKAFKIHHLFSEHNEAE